MIKTNYCSKITLAIRSQTLKEWAGGRREFPETRGIDLWKEFWRWSVQSNSTQHVHTNIKRMEDNFYSMKYTAFQLQLIIMKIAFHIAVLRVAFKAMLTVFFMTSGGIYGLHFKVLQIWQIFNRNKIRA